jgi:hypothetical protein
MDEAIEKFSARVENRKVAEYNGKFGLIPLP